MFTSVIFLSLFIIQILCNYIDHIIYRTHIITHTGGGTERSREYTCVRVIVLLLLLFSRLNCVTRLRFFERETDVVRTNGVFHSTARVPPLLLHHTPLYQHPYGSVVAYTAAAAATGNAPREPP